MPGKRASVFLLTGMVALGLGAPASATEPPLWTPSQPGDEEFGAGEEMTQSEAIRFRESFGLRSDSAFVGESLLDKSSFDSDLYGMPLSATEVADLLHRGEMQQLVDGTVDIARASEFFAGVYLDQLSGGQAVFMFTESDPLAERSLAAALPEDGAFRVERALRTERELLALKDRLDSDLPVLREDGIEVVRVAFQASRNTLLIGVHGLTDATTKTLAERYGPGLVVFEDDIAEADACTSSNNCRPIKGGIAINDASGISGQCTAGFIVDKYDVDAWYVLTAGHCIQANSGYDQVWEHNNDSFGRARKETWVPGSTGIADVGLITIYSDELAQMTNKNQVRRTNSTVTAVRNASGTYEGYQACRVGINGGHDCGLVTNYPATRESEAGGQSMWVTRTATYNFDSVNGDSGGPVFFYSSVGVPTGGTSGPEISALGTHVHSEVGAGANESWYSPWADGSNAYDALVDGFPYSPCLTATCHN